MRNVKNAPEDNTARSYTYHQHAADVAYAASIDLPVLKAVNEQDVYFAQLTGAATVNLTTNGKANLVKGDRVNLIIPCDGTSRTVTWGTNIKGAAGTLVLAISGKAVVRAIYDGTDLVVSGA